MSIKAMKSLNEAGIKCTALTKGILPAELAELSPQNEYGITLVTLDEQFRVQYEPESAPLTERLAALRLLHDRGCHTWVSIEPYPTPNFVKQDLMPLLEAVSFTDRIIFGRMNYNKRVSGYDGAKQFYNDEAEKVIRFCHERHIDVHIKEGTIFEPRFAAQSKSHNAIRNMVMSCKSCMGILSTPKIPLCRCGNPSKRYWSTAVYTEMF